MIMSISKFYFPKTKFVEKKPMEIVTVSLDSGFASLAIPIRPCHTLVVLVLTTLARPGHNEPDVCCVQRESQGSMGET